MKHFKYYLYGSHFTLQTDHQALLSALKNNRGNKTYQSRLTRRVDRLLPFHFKVEHIAGKDMGFADYLSRHPNSPPTGENMNENHVINIITSLKYALLTQQRKLANQNARKTRTYNDVKNHSNRNEQKQHAFCQINANNQSLFFKPSYLTNFQINNSKQHNHYHPKQITQDLLTSKVYITTRRRPNLDTNNIPITKRHRAQNKTKMDTPQNLTESNTNTIATQTEETNNTGLGRTPLNTRQQYNPFANTNNEQLPEYLKNLHKVLGEEFIAEATRADPQSRSLLQIVQDKDWTTLKHFSRYWHSLKRDLGVTPTGCILYDGKLFIPTQLRKPIMNAIHRKHPGQTGMMHLANLIWFPRIHREIVTLTQNCQPCIKTGKNLKPLIPKNKISELPALVEPNEEVQLDFAGPITDEQYKESYILASVDRYSRYLHAKVYHNCDAETAISYLNQYIKFHGIPKNIRCDQAQAFKSRQFEIFCKNNNIKLILAPVGDHRATGMIERLIQTIKRRLSAINSDTNWSQVTLADKVAQIIQEIKLIPNTSTQITPYTAHFGRKANTPLSNITTKPSQNNLSYKNIKNFYLDKRRGLKQPMLNAESIWNIETDSEPELDIRFNEDTPDEDSASDNSTLQNVKKKAAKRKLTSPIKIIPDKLTLTFGDKTTTITKTKKQVARKTLSRRSQEPRGTLKPLWNIIPDGTIINYSPTTITLDTHNRKNVVVRKNDLAIINETKPRLMHFVACKTVREYNRNQEKIKEFLLTEKKNQKNQPNKKLTDHAPES